MSIIRKIANCACDLAKYLSFNLVLLGIKILKKIPTMNNDIYLYG